MLSIVAARIPESARLLVWFAVMFGLAAGWVSARLVELCRMPFPCTIGILSAFLILGGEIANSFLAHRRQVPELERIIANQLREQDPLAAIEQQFLEEPVADEAPEAQAARQQLRIARERSDRARREKLEPLVQRLTWHGYLQHRVSEVGAWPSPWPEALWSAELLVGSVAGAWLASRAARRPFCRVCSTWLEPTRSVILTDDAARRAVDLLGATTPEPLSNDSRLHLHLLTCRCAEPATIVACDLEQHGRRRPLRLAAQPASAQLRELLSLMTSPEMPHA
jgi:hypothetical protein